jgi:putative inorganic carbon (hco3(-)) transporter
MIGFCLFLYGFFSWFKPGHALGLLIILLPTYQIKFYLGSIPFTFLEALILILFLICFLKQGKSLFKIKDKLKDWWWPVFIWLVVATGAMFLSPNLRAGAGVWRAYFIEPILFLIVFLNLIQQRKDLKIVGVSLLITSLYLSLGAILQKFFNQGILSTEIWGQEQILRVTSVFNHPNFLGLFLGPLIVLGLGQIFFLLKNKKKTTKISLAFLYFIICFLALVLARSEGAILGLLIALIFWGLISLPQKKKFLIAIIIVFLVVFLVPLSRDYILEKALFKDLSGQFRINIWQGAIKLLKTSPLIGVGLDGYQKLISNYQAQSFKFQNQTFWAFSQPTPHNLFLALWLELGLLGLGVFVWLMIKFFAQGLKNIKKEPVLIGSGLASLVVILIHGLVDTPYFKNDLAVLFWLIIGLNIVNKKIIESKNSYE